MKDSGGPAFPRNILVLDHGPSHGEVKYQEDGMTLRDWFAGKALAGFTVGLGGYITKEEYTPYAKGACNAEVVARCFVLADAMLEERSKP